jgi:cellulose biosynthesis protein BcsQ
MTKFITISTQKGGCGKSTITTLLASYLHYKKGYKVAIFDCDSKQHSISDIREHELGVLNSSDYWRQLLDAFLEKNNIEAPYDVKPFDIDKVTVETLLQFSSNYCQTNHIDFLLFDFAGSLSTNNLLLLLLNMDYIFVPFYAEQFAFSSSYAFYAGLGCITQEKDINHRIKKILGFWNDREDNKAKLALVNLQTQLEDYLVEHQVDMLTSVIPHSSKQLYMLLRHCRSYGIQKIENTMPTFPFHIIHNRQQFWMY